MKRIRRQCLLLALSVLMLLVPALTGCPPNSRGVLVWLEPYPELTEEQLLSERPKAKILGGLPIKRVLPAPRPVSRAWTPRDRAILDLHFRYVTEVWEFNNWKLYQRYKRHLPAAMRSEVDDLVSRIMSRDPESEIRSALEAILDSVWEADDWAAAIRDPSILVGDVTPDSAFANQWGELVERTLRGSLTS